MNRKIFHKNFQLLQLLFVLLFPFLSWSQNQHHMSSPLSFLALGDSYTIGESVLLQKSFPYQTVQILRKEGYSFSAPEIIARTGWTTDELEEGIRQHRFADKYDFVSLLIGVNNQYRGRDVMVFKMEFEELLKKAIAFAGSKPTHVIVLSIPDYSRTSYAEGKDTERISKEIEIFNNVVKAVSIQYKVQYIDIAQSTKGVKEEPEQLAPDGLHPSEKIYKIWSQKVAGIIQQQLK